MFRFPLLSVMFCVSGLVLAQEKQSAEKVHPIEAELVSSLKVPGAKQGDRILAKLEKVWSYQGCTLPRGSVIAGIVKSITEAGVDKAKETQVSLLFSVSCGDMKDQALRWIALLGPEDLDLAGLHDGNPVAVQAFRSSSFGEGGGVGSGAATQQNHVDLSGRQTPNFPVFVDPVRDTRVPRPAAVKTGEVWRIPRLSLRVSEGPEKSSVLSTTKKHLSVPSHATVVLTLPGEAPPTIGETTSVVAAAGTVGNRGAATAPLPSEKIACEPSTCAFAPSTEESGADPRPVKTLSLSGLGYRRLRAAELQDLEYGAAMAFLGTDRLLFTFDPHTLISRSTEDAPESAAHMVRGVIFNLETGEAEQSLDWRVSDTKQYLWQMSQGQVLVHNGDSLSWIGGGGDESGELATLKLSGPLAFVRSSPDRRHFAVGVRRELHSAEDHAVLAVYNSSGPEEEVTVSLLNDKLEKLSETRQSSLAMLPILSNGGRIVLAHGGGERWLVSEMGWEGGSRLVGRVNSFCVPRIESLGQELLLVAGCAANREERWYRVMRMDGSLVLKGSLRSEEVRPIALTEPGEGLFALALPRGNAGYVPDTLFRGTDLSSETVRVYRSGNGESLFSAKIHLPAPTKQPVAFGDGRIAVLDGDSIVLYDLPAKR